MSVWCSHFWEFFLHAVEEVESHALFVAYNLWYHYKKLWRIWAAGSDSEQKKVSRLTIHRYDTCIVKSWHLKKLCGKFPVYEMKIKICTMRSENLLERKREREGEGGSRLLYRHKKNIQLKCELLGFFKERERDSKLL